MTRRVLKVGIAGTHSTGKSTLLNALETQLEAKGFRVAIVRDLAAAAKDAGFPILTEQTIDTAFWIMAEGIRREAVAALIHDVILVDRAIFDALGYLDAALHVTGRDRNEFRYLILEDIARTYSRDYDLLVVTKLDEALPLGTGRDTNSEFRGAAGRKILAFAESLGRNFITMTYTNRNEVEQEILTFVQDHLVEANRI